jgi:ribosome-associated translation inhibitor RaiA
MQRGSFTIINAKLGQNSKCFYMSVLVLVEESESGVERVCKEILAAIDNAMEKVSTVVNDEREKRAKRTSGNRRDGWMECTVWCCYC